MTFGLATGILHNKDEAKDDVPTGMTSTSAKR